jgi:hypothetical protein
MGAISLLTSTSLGSDTSLWTISSIPTTKTHLFIQVHIRTTSTDYPNATVFINGNTGSNYQIRDMYASSASGGNMKQIYDNFGSNPWLYLGSLTGTTSSSDRYSNLTIYIPRYSNTSIKKYVTGWGQLDPAGGSQGHEWCYGVVNDTSAVTSIGFRHYSYGSGANIGSGSKIWVYGID